MRAINLTGKTFGSWTVVSRAGSDIRGQAIWLCKCRCGEKSGILGASLRTGNSTQCAKCGQQESRKKRQRGGENIGIKFGFLTVVGLAPDPGLGRTKLRCVCVCGKEKNSLASDLRRGFVTSCGCMKVKRLERIANARTIDLTGLRFGRLTVIEKIHNER